MNISPSLRPRAIIRLPFLRSTSIVEPNLHALFHNLADRDQILRCCWNMQDVLDVGLIAVFAEWDITDILNKVNCAIPNFHKAGPFGLLQLSEPIFLRPHVIDTPNRQTIRFLSWRCWSGLRPTLSSLFASLQTICYDRGSRILRRSW